MRLKQYRSNTRRGWEIPLALILRFATAYALPLPDALRALTPSTPSLSDATDSAGR